MHKALFSRTSRRDFICQGAMGLAGVAAGLSAAGCVSKLCCGTGKKIPVGLELYSVRQQCAQDLPGVLAAVSKMGYHGVEFAGYHGRSAQELRKMLDDNGLVTCGTHTPYAAILGDQLKATIEFNRVIGNRFIIIPWMEGKSKQGWLDKAAQFNQLADQLKAEGMWIGYHAHAHDFQKFDGETAWDLFFGNTKAEVIMQLDTGNCCAGGADPLVVLKKYPGRARSIHVKASGGKPGAVIGEDALDWPAIFAWCESRGGTEWYVIEHESGSDPLAAVKRSLEAMKKMGRA